MKVKHVATNDFINVFWDFKNKEDYNYFYYISFPDQDNYFFACPNKVINLSDKQAFKRLGVSWTKIELIITKQQYLINIK